MSVRLRFRRKQFWHLPLPVNVPLRVRVWHCNFNTSQNTSERANRSSLIWDFFFDFDTDSNRHPIDNQKATSAEACEFWATLKLHCAMRISGIAVVSSIAIPEPVSLSSFQFQVSHNTTFYRVAWNAMRILSVCLSVCRSNACIVTKRKKVLSKFLYHTRFMRRRMVGGAGATPSTWYFGSTGPRWSKMAYFKPIFALSASSVTPSKKV